MKVADIIKYLRMNVNVQMTGAEGNDPKYLEMTDEDIKLFLQVVMTRDFPDVYSLETLQNENVYSVVLLAKIELFYSLAVKNANMIDMVADNNNQLRRNQLYSNYMKLIAQAKEEYDQYIETGGAGKALTSYNVFIPNRYNTRYNQERGFTPALLLFLDLVTHDYIDVHWDIKTISQFQKCEVYISKEPIFDIYENAGSRILEKSIRIKVTKDYHDVTCKIRGLTPSTEYYVGVACYDQSGHVGYSQCRFKTELLPIEEPLVEDTPHTPAPMRSRRSVVDNDEMTNGSGEISSYALVDENAPEVVPVAPPYEPPKDGEKVDITNQDVQDAFQEGVQEVFESMFTNQVYYHPIDLEATGDLGIYQESKEVKYKEPIRLDACKVITAPTNDVGNEVADTEYDAVFTVPTYGLKAKGINVSKDNWKTLTQGVFTYKDQIYGVSRISTGANVADEYIYIIFTCKDLKKRSV